jgi:hypothetical protein
MAEHKDTELMVPVGFEHLISLTAKAVVNEAIPQILKIAKEQTVAAINEHKLACGDMQETLAAEHRAERAADNKRHAEELVKVATDRNWDKTHPKSILSRKQWAALIGLLTLLTTAISGALVNFLNRLGTHP